MKAGKKIQRLPLELREVLDTTYRGRYVLPAISKAVGDKIACEFIFEFNTRDAARNYQQTEVLFYELGCDYLNPILNTLGNKPPENNAFLILLLDCLEERMGFISIAHHYREKHGRGRWSKTDLTYDYDGDKYPYI